MPNPITYAIPGFLALLAVEVVVTRAGERRYCPRDAATSLAMGIGSQLIGALSLAASLGIAFSTWRFRVFTMPDAWWTWPLCFVLYDLCYYGQHRAMHRVRWMWASHVNHHSSQHYNLSTALRQSWTGFVAGNFLFYLPLYLLGFPPPMVFFVGALNLIYQFWIHTEVVGRMPAWFEAVMNTPSHHRVHHAVNPRYLDRNYAGVFIVWDKLFGTFGAERDDERPRYGIVNQLPNWNFAHAVFHEWVGIARDLRRAPWRAKLGYVARLPGWSHDGSRDTSDQVRRRWENERCQGTPGSSISSSSAAVREAAPPPAG